MKAREGYTIVEVIVAILVCSVMISSVFSVAVTNKTSSGKVERKLAANLAAQALMQKLKSYQSADPFHGLPDSRIRGPSGGAPGPCSWTLNSGQTLDSYGGACPWALAPLPGIHGITGAGGLPGFVPSTLFAPPFNGVIRYTVTWLPSNAYCYNPPNAVPLDCTPKIDVTLVWTEPQTAP
jgi:type II secretory pathway pseudopilin PulG